MHFRFRSNQISNGIWSEDSYSNLESAVPFYISFSVCVRLPYAML